MCNESVGLLDRRRAARGVDCHAARASGAREHPWAGTRAQRAAPAGPRRARRGRITAAGAAGALDGDTCAAGRRVGRGRAARRRAGAAASGWLVAGAGWLAQPSWRQRSLSRCCRCCGARSPTSSRRSDARWARKSRSYAVRRQGKRRAAMVIWRRSTASAPTSSLPVLAQILEGVDA